MTIITVLAVLSQCLDGTSLKQLTVIVSALLAMSGRVTMLGLSRWAEGGGSYRTIQRFYNTVVPWGMVLWLLFRSHLYRPGDEYLLIGDESVVTKAGKETYGLDRFFSSIFGKPVRGLAFFAFSVVSVRERKSYPLLVEQVVRSAEEKAAVQQKAAKRTKRTGKKGKSGPKSGQAGRPKGRPNKDKRIIVWTPELRRLADMASGLLQRINPLCAIRYLILDGHFGNNNVTQLVRQFLALHIVSKLRHDAALYFCYTGAQKARGAKKYYGPKVDYDQLPAQYLVRSSVQAGIRTDIYQATMLHKSFADPLNVVILLKTNLATQQRAHVLLFSSDLTLAYDKLIDYYRLRFQIEFNFRDAKQFWGFEDFMNVQQTPVTNAVGLAFLMVNLSQILLAHLRRKFPNFSVLDLKALFRTRRYAQELFKLLPDSPDPILMTQLLDSMPLLGAIHPEPDCTVNP
jgi:putative transposase